MHTVERMRRQSCSVQRCDVMKWDEPDSRRSRLFIHPTDALNLIAERLMGYLGYQDMVDGGGTEAVAKVVYGEREQ